MNPKNTDRLKFYNQLSDLSQQVVNVFVVKFSGVVKYDVLRYLQGKIDAKITQREYQNILNILVEKGLAVMSATGYDVEFCLKIELFPKLIKEIRALIKANKKSLITEQFSFCQKYRATPESMLSYLEWTPERIIAEARRLPMQTTFIMGSRDDRLGEHWIERLQQTKAKVRVIEGANHFMDGDFEFDLLDTVLLELKTL